ncbi:MAG: hypothetical protein FWD24_07765, partial [Treponema sp.]|nr:hypothetical protein [Treponema sp.]
WATISGIAGSNTNGSVINCVSLVQTFEDWYDGGVFAIASGGTLTNNWRRNGLLGTSNNPNDNNGGLITTANAGALWNTLGFTAANSPLWANPANLPNLSNFANP